MKMEYSIHAKLKSLLLKFRNEPHELQTALSAVPAGELVHGIVRLFIAGELSLIRRKRRETMNLCARGDAYDRANPWVRDWFLRAAQEKRDEGRTNYGIGNLLEKLRHDVSHGIVRADDFRISNDLQSYYVRQVLMRDPSLCGLFKLARRSNADALVVDGRAWTDFAKEHEAELWPESTLKKKNGSAAAAQFQLALRKTA
jgi:hypothetical protein